MLLVQGNLPSINGNPETLDVKYNPQLGFLDILLLLTPGANL
jgi:hypothetical protein